MNHINPQEHISISISSVLFTHRLYVIIFHGCCFLLSFSCYSFPPIFLPYSSSLRSFSLLLSLFFGFVFLVYVYVSLCVSFYVFVYVYVCVCVHLCVCMCVCVYVCIIYIFSNFSVLVRKFLVSVRVKVLMVKRLKRHTWSV